ncbi:hypothetical protein DFQ27_005279 [Actinomortierella ambigua]|uniref:Uncharacterized protein n=1 Tax=Actinomortierella ambigua TaxID=1343610 RepID=A0A9P6Q113_9FUNG|nr:hypothetical protein DFQ27_005279 [Actinomortierella ambigua]
MATVFEDSVPQATVQIITLFRDHNVLLSKCRVLSPTTRIVDRLSPPREPSPENVYVVPDSPPLKPSDEDLSDNKANLDKDDIHISTRDSSMKERDHSLLDLALEDDKPLTLECVLEDASISGHLPVSHQPDDSIAGLHTDLERLAFLASSQGSEMGTQPLARQRILEELEHFNPSMLASQMANVPTNRGNKSMVMPSSQGSEDGLNDVDQDWQDERHHQLEGDSPSSDVVTVMSTRASPELVSGSTDAALATSDDDVQWNERLEPTEKNTVAAKEPKFPSEQAVEVIDLESDLIQQGSSEKASARAFFERSETMESISSVASSPSAWPDVQPGPIELLKQIDLNHPGGEATEQEEDSARYIYVLFSNTFQWSTLKVMDRVEIHAPFREIKLKGAHAQVPPESPFSSSYQSVWVADKYRVIPSSTL